MRLLQAKDTDLQRVREHYRNIIKKTPDIHKHSMWEVDVHPSEQDLKDYIAQGAMYLLLEGDQIVGSMALADGQDPDYALVAWGRELPEEEVCSVHILGVSPDLQRRGIGGRLVDEALALGRAKGKKALRLNTLSSNTPAQHLYASKGLQLCGEHRVPRYGDDFPSFYYYEYLL